LASRDQEATFINEAYRSLLITGLQVTVPEKHAHLCRVARHVYAKVLRSSYPSSRTPERLAIETLYLFLKENTMLIQTTDGRTEVREKLLNVILPEVLHLLAKTSLPKESLVYMISRLEADKDFRFTINYYLREDNFSDEPFDTLILRMRRFFRKL
jgi:hypothetical protein